MANRYWVNDGGTWNSSSTSNWSTTSGGPGGASVPTSSDIVYFDLNSGDSATVTLSGTLNCHSLYIDTKLTINFSSSTINIVDYFSFVEDEGGAINFNSATINVGRYFWGNDYNPNFNAGTSTINLGSVSGSSQFYGGGLTYYNLVITGPSALIDFFPSSENNNLAAIFNNLTYNENGSYLNVKRNFYVNGALSLTASSTSRMYVIGNGKTITTNGSVSISYVNFEDVLAGGTAIPWTGTSIGDCLGNSNITFTPAVTRYAVAPGSINSIASWSTTSGGGAGASIPLPQDTAIFDSNSVVGTYIIDLGQLPSINCTNFSRTLSFSGQVSVYGGLVVPSTTTVSVTGKPTIFLTARSSTSLQFNSSANLLLQVARTDADYTASGQIGSGNDLCKLELVVDRGSFNASTNSLQLVKFSSSSGTTVNMGSGTWTLQGSTATTIWDVSGTLNKQTANIVIGTGTNVSFYGGGKSYNKITISGRSETYTVTFYGNNTISELDYTTGTGTHTLKFQSGTTTNINKWSVRGISGRQVVVGSTTTSAHTLNFTGQGSAVGAYLNLSYSTATPTGKWYAGSTSTDSGNNTGWLFYDPPQPNLFFGSNF